MADADETFGQQMQQEATQELIERKCHQLLVIIMSGVTPTKGALAVFERNQSMVRDSHAVGITAEVVEHILRTTERWFGIDDPIFAKQRPEPRREGLRLREASQIAGEVQLPSLKGRLEPSDELPAKYAPEHLDGEEESRARANPTCAIEGEPTRGDDTVDVRMKLEFLIPGVQHAEEADLGTEMGGVTSHFE